MSVVGNEHFGLLAILLEEDRVLICLRFRSGKHFK
jgi:hypothetical protein